MVAYEDAEPSGLALMLGGLIEQNLARDPGRRRLLRSSVVAIEARDAEVSVTIMLAPGGALIGGGFDRGAHVRIRTDSARLLALATAPLRFGLPDPFSRAGREVVRDIAARRIEVAGMISHPRRLARLTMLLSAD